MRKPGLVYREAHRFTSLDRPTKDGIKNAVHRISMMDPDLIDADALYFIVMELYENAYRANLKRAWFEQNGSDVHHTNDHDSLIADFGEFFKDATLDQQETLLSGRKFDINVAWYAYEECIRIYVANNSKLERNEERRIREKLDEAMTTLPKEFCLNRMDHTEGSGLGIGMIIFIMRGLGLNPGNFRIYSRAGSTIARLEIPRQTSYITIRGRQALGA